MSSRFTMRQLGKTGLQVSPIGIGAGNGLSSQDLLYAFEQGINYFFYSSDLHHHTYQQAAQGLRELCSAGSSVRDKMVLATVTYIDNPEKLTAILLDMFCELKIEYIDVFHWGWITDRTDMLSLLRNGQQLKKECSEHQVFREFTQVATYVNAELLKRGLVRYVGASFHSRKQARKWMKELDVMMLRYNITHLGVEQDVVPYLYGDKDRDPGVVVFNVAHEGRLHFHIPPLGYPEGQYIPSIRECYRFALTHPWVDLVLAGPINRWQVNQLLAAIEQGPLSQEECTRMCAYGAFYSAQASAFIAQATV
ncbi:MAG TPA: hypothetical protein VFB12_10830 [Ktedonobacteraceae bacterium]|nr:hypothetical protein [Ktedonobacteraceae bacterium]